ncbi:efflux RND transporter periplasmic adaptor subunit [Paludibaculum fermentans]|uniref:Efflux RND transporter periplasmic adaptor subunit n=1 Tax=Paludibaculum fermentans TaxID=1473598 RepID=A0A7S7SPN6_PALFE|nr:efflux RND transporter periplasmic adaptor subunit [Paludibaculum fermentans]QOY91345.1 efflux RND transporter periplasmic adaptor subunit [Paludibaculum fermentans]
MKRRLFPLLAAVVAGGCLVGYLALRPRAVAASVEPEKVTTVGVARVSRHDLAKTMTVTAELIPFQEVEVMAKVAGYVQKMYVDVGDHVTQGQLLAVLEVPEMQDDLVRAAASIQRNRAELAKAKDELRRAESANQMTHLAYTRLAEVLKSQPGLVAQQEIDDAQGRDLMAAAQVAAAKSALVASQEQISVSEAEQTKLRTLMSYARVSAPFTGVVTKRFADNGSMIQAGTASHLQAMPIVRLSQNQLLRLVMPVPESAAGLMRRGATLDVRIPTLQRAFRGVIARTSDKVDSATRTMETEVDVPNPAGELIPGMFAEVDLTLAASKDALAVPVSALKEKDGGRTVYVVDSGGKVAIRKVQTGIETALLAEVRNGLEPGDMVITSNPGQLMPGQTVKPKVEGGAE